MDHKILHRYGKENDTLEEERVKTLQSIFQRGWYYQERGMLEEIILGFVQKKTAMLQDAKTKGELQEISKPPKPIYDGNGFTPGKYDTEEEEMLVWSLTSLKAPLNSQAYYICQTYNRMSCKVCSSHKIEARDLYNLVLKDIQELAAQTMKDDDAFYQRLSSRMEHQYLVDTSQTEKDRKQLEARNQEIDGMFLSLYTDKAKGILTEQRFMKLTAALEQEEDFDWRGQKVDGQKVQEVRIVYNFVGEIPEIAA